MDIHVGGLQGYRSVLLHLLQWTLFTMTPFVPKNFDIKLTLLLY